ncbi:MAG: hypothetical protein KGL53_04775, partial [Elusimicrobia bacterium]|nr:hypothetical protein [Elusimicrobiota bacterium]
AAPQAAAPAAAAPSSLGYLKEANAPPPAPPPDRAVDAPASVAVKTANPPVSNETTPDRPAALPSGPRPKLAHRAMPQVRGNPGGNVTFTPMNTLAGNIGSGFQQVYRPPRTGAFQAGAQKRAAMAARRAVVGSHTGAMDQARFAGKVSRSAMGMSAASAASYTAGQPFDGSAGAGSLGATRPSAGASEGGAGVASSASTAKDTRNIQAPPAPTPQNPQNKTPYQKYVIAGMAALAIGALLLIVAGKVSDEAKADPTKAPLAQMLAAAAMAAGAAAAAIGGLLAGKFGQMTQGMPFLLGGGAIAVQAGMVLAKGSEASKEASDKTTGAANAAAATTTTNLNSPGPIGSALNPSASAAPAAPAPHPIVGAPTQQLVNPNPDIMSA